MDPNLTILQPLVENAVRHGNLSRRGQGRIEVTARTEGPTLRLKVQDDGPGTEVIMPGVGLSNTERRLQLLYGEKQKFAAGNQLGGGFCVAMELPLRRSEWAL